MNDRQFMRLLAIVVATGLVLGLVAFRATRSGDPAADGARRTVAGPATGTTASASGRTGDDAGSGASQPAPVLDSGVAIGGEPTTPTKEPPPMQGSATLDSPAETSGAAPPSPTAQ